MLSNEEVEKRHGPPGVNSRSLSAAHSAADLEVSVKCIPLYSFSKTIISLFLVKLQVEIPN